MDRGQQSTIPTDDWASRATKMVEQGVEFVQYRSIRPVTMVVKGVVIGVLVSIVSLFLVIAGAIGVVRLLTEDAFGGRVWASDLIVGGIFAASGAFLLLRSRAPKE